MRPKCFYFALVAAFCLSLLPWQGSIGGILCPCLAWAQPVKIQVLSEVKSDRKRVCLLDLCNASGIPEELKNLLEQADIGEAPAPGSEKIINPEQLQTYIQRLLVSKVYDSSQVEFSFPEKILIRRESFQVPTEQIEEIYKGFILSNTPWNSQGVSIRGVYFNGPMELPTGSMTYEVTADPRERFAGNVTLTIQFFIDGEKDRSLRVTGKVDIYRDTPHAARPIKRNAIITEGDIQMRNINIADTPDRFAADSEQVVGKRLLRDVGLHQPIVLSDLDKPPALKRGSAVTIVYEQPGLKLTAKGQTREDGGVGSSVRVVNLMTNRTVFCRVVDRTTVQAIP
ncbi:MAG: flagellar basal body P-ring formation chaperone FlgA [Syntrophobacteraceae bacterium]